MAADKRAGCRGGLRLLQSGGQAAEGSEHFVRCLIEVQIRAGRQRQIPGDAVQSCPDQQGKGKIGIAQRIRRPKLRPPVLPLRRRDPNELGTILRRPRNVAGRLAAPEPAIGFLLGVQKQRHIRNSRQNPGNSRRQHIPAIGGSYGKVDVQTVSRTVCQRLRAEICPEAIPGRRRIHHGAERHSIVRRRDGI